MNILFGILLFLRVRGKWAGDLFMWWYKKQINKIIAEIDLDAKDIKIIEETKK